MEASGFAVRKKMHLHIFTRTILRRTKVGVEAFQEFDNATPDYDSRKKTRSRVDVSICDRSSITKIEDLRVGGYKKASNSDIESTNNDD